MSGLIPRTIRGQLILGTALLQCLLVAGVFGYVYHQQRATLRQHTSERLHYQIRLLSQAITLAMRNSNIKTGDIQSILNHALDSPRVRSVRLTDLGGHTLAYSSEAEPTGTTPALSTAELQQAHASDRPRIFDNGNEGLVAVADVDVNGTPSALVWIVPDISEDQVDLSTLLRSALIFALLAILINALFSMIIARSVTRPLRGLLRGTKSLIRDPERGGIFPIQTHSINEAGQLTRSFNTMVAELREQRSGLQDTLALLDSMLANAPIGFAFFDRKGRYVRINQFLAEMDGVPIHRHLGHTVQEILPGAAAIELNAAIDQVFRTAAPVREMELNLHLASLPDSPRIWLTSLYPVRIVADEPPLDRSTEATDGDIGTVSSHSHVRWVGAVLIDSTDRKLAEEMLRRTEKLAATGRLAASIAHEINNPLEAVTNLLYLLQRQDLQEEAHRYADMAQQELARVSQITQQTLRFYRQSSRPVAVRPGELLDSVLNLHRGRISGASIEVVRRYRGDIQLVAMSGELRQVFANIIGNALDAMPKGGRLLVSVRQSSDWKQSEADPEAPGVRIVIADTGSGMSPGVRRRIFEAFFTTKETTGTGLGLWISSGIIAKHKGTIRVRSRRAIHAQTADADGVHEADHVADPDANASDDRSGTVFMMFFPFDGISGLGPEPAYRSNGEASERLSEVER